MAIPETPFWFLRHGETDYNARGLSQGALDIPLNANGRAQARAAAALLAHRGIVGIISSPMLRTRETTDIVNQVLQLPVAYESDFREVVFGGMAGRPLMPWFQAWLAGTRTPEGAETFAALTARVAAALARVLGLPGPILIVAHGGVFHAIRDLLGQSPDTLAANADPLFCNPTKTGWQILASI